MNIEALSAANRRDIFDRAFDKASEITPRNAGSGARAIVSRLLDPELLAGLSDALDGAAIRSADTYGCKVYLSVDDPANEIIARVMACCASNNLACKISSFGNPIFGFQ
jgi:hypothetical protein